MKKMTYKSMSKEAGKKSMKAVKISTRGPSGIKMIKKSSRGSSK